MSDEAKSVSVPKWDGKAKFCPRYLAKIKALAEYYNCGDALDEAEMKNCPNLTEFKLLSSNSSRTADEDRNIELYKMNKRLCAIIVLGQDSDHRLVAMDGTVIAGLQPHGRAYKFLKVLNSKYKPKDASTKISLSSSLRAVQFKMANDYFNDVMSVLARFNIRVSQTKLIKIMAEQVKGESAINHLKLSPADHSLEVLCDEIAQVQCLLKASGGNDPSLKGQKEVNLTSTDGKNGGKKGGSDKKAKGDKTDKTCNHCGRRNIWRKIVGSSFLTRLQNG